MGGQVSEVSAETTRVLLEVANWNGTNILRTSRQLGLRSEASSRFEKQLHPELCMRAQRIASRLMVELCGAKLVPGTIDVAAEIPAPPTLTLRGARVEGLLGMAIAQADQVAYLERLGFGVEAAGEDLAVTVPPDRHYDVTREVDLIEEVGRVHGLDEHLPSTLPGAAGQAGGLSREQRLRRRAEDAMRDLGFDEIVGWSFTDPGEPGRLRIAGRGPARAGGRDLQPALRGPVGDAHDPARLAARRRPRATSPAAPTRVALFESGRVYLSPPTGRKPPMPHRPVGPLAGSSSASGRRRSTSRTGSARSPSGRWSPSSWRGGEEPADFFALKGVLEAPRRRSSASPLALRAGRGAVPAPRPRRRGARRRRRRPAGSASSTRWSAASGTSTPAAASKSTSAPLIAAASRRRGDLRGRDQLPGRPPGPRRRRRRRRSPAARVRDAVLAGGGELLRSAEVFDLYEGEQVGEGRKSLALRLEFRAADRTLTDEEVAGVRGLDRGGAGRRDRRVDP